MSLNDILHLLLTGAIGLAPVLLHAVDKLLERFSPFNEEYIRKKIVSDPSRLVASVGQRRALFLRVKTYFYFEREFHFIITLVIFNILSLFVTQAECTHSVLQGRWPTFLGIVVLLLFLLVFLWRTLNNDFDPAAAHPTRRWLRAALASFLVVMLIEAAFHQDVLPEWRPTCIG